MIKPPFANYPRAHLERLVREGFELIEREAHRRFKSDFFYREGVYSAFEFQVLVAADYYLRSTKED